MHPPEQSKAHWLFGNALELKKDFVGSLGNWQANLGDFYSFHLMNKPYFAASHPNYIKHILQPKSLSPCLAMG